MKRCKHGWVYCWGANESGQTVRRFECTYQYALVSVLARFVRPVAMIECSTCGHTLSLGPANDSVKPAPLPRREMADFRDTGWSWDISRPIAEQLAETARVDADAATAWRDWAKDNMISHEEYEALRAAEPDCRDEDEPTDPTTKFGHLANQVTVSVHDLGAKDPNEDTMRDPEVTAHNAEVIAQRSLVASPEVCACTGDALLSATCEVSP